VNASLQVGIALMTVGASLLGVALSRVVGRRRRTRTAVATTLLSLGLVVLGVSMTPDAAHVEVALRIATAGLLLSALGGFAGAVARRETVHPLD